MRNVLIVLSGPSGVGKGTVARILTERNNDLALSISCTTRAPRITEQNGREYFFITKAEFEEKKNAGGFLEYSEHFENCYGTPKDFALEKLQTKNVLLEIDVNGGLEVKKNYSDAVLIMLVPPSREEIKRRLLKRSTETEDKIELRMQRIDYELGKSNLYDYTVVNDELMVAVEEIEKIIKTERNR